MVRTTQGARLLAAVGVGLVLLLVAPSAASARPNQTIDDLKEKAKNIAAELERLQKRSDDLNESYLDAKLQVDDLKQKMSVKEGEVASAKSNYESNRKTAKDYIIRSYVSGGTSDPTLLPSKRVDDAANRAAFLNSLRSDKEQAMEDVRAAGLKLDEEKHALSSMQSKVDSKVKYLEKTRTDLKATIAKQTEIQKNTDDKLKAAVEAEQQRIAAAQAEAARQAAQEEADRAARAAARRAAEVPAIAVVREDSTPSANNSGSGERAMSRTAQELPDPGPVSPAAAKAIAAAKEQLGVPYRWGASSPGRAFDCSGLTLYAWGAAGRSLPHSSRAQRGMTPRISADELRPGDLVFFGSPVHHVGLYIGNGLMIHAPHTGDVVRIASIYSSGSPHFGRMEGSAAVDKPDPDGQGDDTPE